MQNEKLPMRIAAKQKSGMLGLLKNVFVEVSEDGWRITDSSSTDAGSLSWDYMTMVQFAKPAFLGEDDRPHWLLTLEYHSDMSYTYRIEEDQEHSLQHFYNVVATTLGRKGILHILRRGQTYEQKILVVWFALAIGLVFVTAGLSFLFTMSAWIGALLCVVGLVGPSAFVWVGMQPPRTFDTLEDALADGIIGAKS